MSNIDEKENFERIKVLSKELKLPYVMRNVEDEIKEANLEGYSFEAFLKEILEREYDLRKENGKKSRVRLAKFPYKKYIEDLVIEDLPEDARSKVKLFSSLEFIKTGQNIILAGNPGTGKTHISIGLGIKACNAGYRVLFTTIPLLVNELKECRSQKTLRAFERNFEKYDLIIADELGYISFDKEASEL